MIVRTLVLLAALFAASVDATAADKIKAGDSWTFEAHDGYRGKADIIAAYRVEVTAASDNEIAVHVTSLTDGWVGDERYTRAWNPVSASGLASFQPYVFALGYQGFSNVMPPHVGWQPEAPRRSVYSRLPVAQHYEFLPAYPEFPDRLEPGVSWRGETVSRETTSGRQVKMKVFGKVICKQRIRVPAGEFDTIKLVRQTYLDDANYWHGPTLVETSEWFAPELGRSVKYETRSQYHEISATDPTVDRGDWTVYELAPDSAR